MTDEVDPRFLGEQIKRLRSDFRQLKSDMAQVRADHAKADRDIVAVNAAVSRLGGSLEAFRESIDDRFDQQIELLKSSFHWLSLDIQTLKKT
jgi:hypothetical protein